MPPGARLGGSEAARLLAFARRMARGEPLSRVLGRREFWGLDFALSADTLDPRPDSETSSRRCSRGYPIATAPLSVARPRDRDGLSAARASVRAADGHAASASTSSEGAAATARRNAEALGFAVAPAFWSATGATRSRSGSM